MHTQQAVLLMSARALLAHLNLSRKITRPGRGEERYIHFRAGGGRSDGKAHYMPFFAQLHRVTILSLLEETGATRASWLPNGQASRGTRELARWGASGNCTLVLSRKCVQEQIAMREKGNRTQGGVGAEQAEAAAKIAPERSRLILREATDARIIELPADEDALTIYRALFGSVQELDAAQWARIEPFVASGIQLEVAHKADRVLLGCPMELHRITRAAA